MVLTDVVYVSVPLDHWTSTHYLKQARLLRPLLIFIVP